MKTNVEHTHTPIAYQARQIVRLEPVETLSVDLDKVFDRFEELDDDSAEREIARHLDRLVDDLAVLRKGYGTMASRDLLPPLRGVTHTSTSLGLQKLARVACDAIICIQQADRAGSGATLARLQRIGDQLMRDLWFEPVGETV